jgi:tetratricopeptide (TPR) repeat protein
MTMSMMKLALALSCAGMLLTVPGCGGKPTAGPAPAPEENVEPLMALSKRMKSAKDIGNSEQQVEEYLAIAKELQALSKFDESVPALKMATSPNLIDWIKDPALSGRVYADVAYYYTRAKKPDDAKKMLDKALPRLDQLAQDPAGKALVEARISIAQHALGKTDEAKKSLQAAVKSAETATTGEPAARTWLAIAGAAPFADPTLQKEAIEKAVVIVKTVTTPKPQSELLIGVARLQHGAKQVKEAEETLAAAATAAETIPEHAERAEMLYQAAALFNFWAKPDKAGPLVDQLEKLYPDISDKKQLEPLQAKVKTLRSQLTKPAAKAEKS